MIRRRLIISLGSFLITALCLPWATAYTNQLAEPTMIDRILHPNRDQESSLQNKTFNPGGTQFEKALKTGEYAGLKQFDTKPFASKAFEGAKKSWLGKLLFHEKKLPDNLQAANRDATKKFDSKELPQKTFTDEDRKSRYASQDAFATREIVPKGKTQGAIDNDQRLQEAVKKGLSIDDIRKLLNKGP